MIILAICVIAAAIYALHKYPIDNKQQNKEMKMYYTVNADGKANLFYKKPLRNGDKWNNEDFPYSLTIENVLNLTWQDDPWQVKVNLSDYEITDKSIKSIKGYLAWDDLVKWQFYLERPGIDAEEGFYTGKCLCISDVDVEDHGPYKFSTPGYLNIEV